MSLGKNNRELLTDSIRQCLSRVLERLPGAVVGVVGLLGSSLGRASARFASVLDRVAGLQSS